MTVPLHVSRRAGDVRSSEIRDLLRLADRPDVISLAGGLPDPSGFPLEAMSAAADLALAEPALSLQYSSTEGDADLRRLVADRHERLTGRPTSVDQVVITTGSQQGLDLAARALADPGEAAVVEDPTYLGALQALRANGLRTLGAPSDEHGLDTEAVKRLLGSNPGATRLVYCVPDFANPTGTTLTDARRRQLADIAQEHDLVVIEDSPYTALRFRGSPVAPIASHTDRVVSLGTVSKTIAPGLRVGWFIGPPEVVEVVVRLKQSVDLHTSGLSQRIAFHLLSRSEWQDGHVAELADRYGARARALRSSLVEVFGDRLVLTDPDGGMFLWATPAPSSPPMDSRALLPLAIEQGTAFVPGDAFAARHGAGHAGSLRLSFATAPPRDLEEAARRLARAVDQLDGRDRPKISRGPLSQVR